jgi:hypothetical protein
VRVFKSKEFSRYARREGISDKQLCEAVRRAKLGLVDADLGGCLIKQRMARSGQGRRGGFRILMAYHATSRAVFVYGFAKNERHNIQSDELEFWRSVAKAFIGLNETQLKTLLDQGEIQEVKYEENETQI